MKIKSISRDFGFNSGTARLILGTIFASAFAFPACGHLEEDRGPINILFLMSDQHGPDDLGHYGNPNALTPNLDKLASSGINFMQAYAQSPVCTPSRTSVLTGLYVHSHGVIGNNRYANQSQESFPSILQKHGYVTACFGKIHTTGREEIDWDVYVEKPDPPEGPMKEGGILLSGTAQLNTLPTLGAPYPYPITDAVEWQSKERAIQFMRENKDRPWLIKYSAHKPHPAWQPPQEYWDMIDRSSLVIPSYPANWHNDKDPSYMQRMRNRGIVNVPTELMLDGMQGYYGNVAFVDAMFGEVLDELDRLGLRDNTLIIYVSDHGEMLGRYGLWTKFVFFDASVRVPLIISMPGITTAGMETDALVELIDLFPTIMDIANVRTPEKVQGQSLLPLIQGRTDTHREVVHSSIQLPGVQNVTGGVYHATMMLYDGRYKFIDNGTKAPPELYDHETDPEELVNIAPLPGNEERVEEMRARLQTWREMAPVANQPTAKEIRRQ